MAVDVLSRVSWVGSECVDRNSAHGVDDIFI